MGINLDGYEPINRPFYFSLVFRICKGIIECNSSYIRLGNDQ